jgi:hypothetical protein
LIHQPLAMDKLGSAVQTPEVRSGSFATERFGGSITPGSKWSQSGMSQKYLLRWALSSGDAIKEAQAKISATMTRSLHGGSEKAWAPAWPAQPIEVA